MKAHERVSQFPDTVSKPPEKRNCTRQRMDGVCPSTPHTFKDFCSWEPVCWAVFPPELVSDVEIPSTPLFSL